MTDLPWIGAAGPAAPDLMSRAAQLIGCETEAIAAVFEVEAGRGPWLKDGSLVRRFEPHKMPGATTTWRDSLKIKAAEREAMFRAAYARTPEAALQATSWGSPQIMGFNHEAAGYETADAMVRAMAEDEGAQIMAFVHLVVDWNLGPAIRAHDWQTFETRYNGGGFGGEYARKIEAAYRRRAGKASPEVLRQGSGGPGVRKLQEALGIEADGHFGPETDAAVRAFQDRSGLPVDGIVGRRTWAALEAREAVPPRVQPTAADAAIDRAVDGLVKGGGGVGVGAVATKALERAPDGAITLLWYGGAVLVLLFAGLVAARVLRRAAR